LTRSICWPYDGFYGTPGKPVIKDKRDTRHTIDLGDTTGLQDIDIFQSGGWQEKHKHTQVEISRKLFLSLWVEV
jgi:hypothetical protein